MFDKYNNSFHNTFCNILDEINDGFAYYKIIYDDKNMPVDYIYLEVNKAFEILRGYKKSDVIGKRVTELFPYLKTSGHDWTRFFDQAVLESRNVKFETYSAEKDRWYSVTVYVHKDGFLSSMFYDISDIKKASESIRMLNQVTLKYLEFPYTHIDYQAITDDLKKLSGAEYIIINGFNYDGTATTLAVSGISTRIRKAVQVLGFDIVGKSWRLADDAINRLKDKKLFKADGIYELSFNRIPYRLCIILESMAKTGASYIIGICHGEQILGSIALIMPANKDLESPDIVELFASQLGFVLLRKKTEEALKENEERWQLTVEGSGDGAWDWNIETNEVYHSQGWKAMIGLQEDDISNSFLDWKKRVHPEDLNQVMEDLDAHMLGENSSYASEYRLRCKDGNYKWILDRGKVLRRASNGKPLRMVGTHTDITDRKIAEEKIKYLSYHDNLTGLYNRTFFENELERLHSEKDFPFSVIIGDVNGLKLANDVFGHFEGDRLLVQIARILEKACREGDIIARWGGDEYAIILPKTASTTAEEICNQITSLCAAEKYEHVQLSIALGCSTKTSASQNNKDIIKQAEDIMYRRKLLDSMSTKSNIISSLKKTLFERSFETEEHAQRMLDISIKIGKVLNLPANQQDELNLLAILHDIGKIGIPDSILMKPGKLTDEEWQEMKKHPEIGYRIANSSFELAHIAEHIISHHERWDGTGYPRGLKGTDISLPARILSMVDAYDVMTHSRPYKEAVSSKEALQEIRRCAGTHFDPELAEIFTNTLLNDM